MVAGKSNKEIGVSLYICEGTVKVHVGSLLKKLKAGGRTEAVNLALTHGIVNVAGPTEEISSQGPSVRPPLEKARAAKASVLVGAPTQSE